MNSFSTCLHSSKNCSTMATLLVLYLIVFSTLFSSLNAKFSERLPLAISTKRMEKMTRLHFYFHDIPSGNNPTAILIAGPPSKMANRFGSTFMMDDPLTEGPEPTSKLVGRAQGMYGLASQHDTGLLMLMNLAFVEGMYNGSTLTILGHNQIMSTVREMPIVGGSGLFRFARGYALAGTVSANQKTGNVVVEYNVSVMHF